MKRSIFHEFQNEFSSSFRFAFTSFSGTASLVVPAAGSHLRVYNVVIDGPSDLSGTTSVEVVDGSEEPIGIAVVQAGSHREFNFLGRFWKVDTAVRFTRPSDESELHVGVWYREVVNKA